MFIIGHRFSFSQKLCYEKSMPFAELSCGMVLMILVGMEQWWHGISFVGLRNKLGWGLGISGLGTGLDKLA